MSSTDRDMTPTLVTSCTSLPPEGAGLPWGGPAAGRMAPTVSRIVWVSAPRELRSDAC